MSDAAVSGPPPGDGCPSPIEDYALIGDLHTAALVGRNGSIDWLCLPRFDSGACFAALLGSERHGRWLIAPEGEVVGTNRRYRDGTLVLETDFATAEGAVRLVDCMAIKGHGRTLVRAVEGLRGEVKMRMELVIRFDYGSTIPWVEHGEEEMSAVAGPDAVYMRTEVDSRGENMRTVAEFTVREGEDIPFTLTWGPSHKPAPDALDGLWAIRDTESWWREWSGSCAFSGEYADEVLRSLIVLKALTYLPTGGIIAAPTTSLPEAIGGERNWDYRYCWLRDAVLTLDALMLGGFIQEALDFGAWVLRATASHPSQTQVLYGVSGERRLIEYELDHLPGYEGSAPVRVGNAAANQFQLDVFGEVLDAAYRGREMTGQLVKEGWDRQRGMLDYLEEIWREPDEGIWEVRGPRRHFTHSKVMAWVGFDRAVKTVERRGADGDVEHWRRIRDEIHEQVCDQGYDSERNTFTQYYGSKELDASTLLIPAVGFLPPDDARVIGTIDAIQSELAPDGWVRRYSTGEGEDEVDGLQGEEGAFLPCSFWLADALAMAGRTGEARRLFERLLGLTNDVGLISEEYDPGRERLIGNFPQAFTHLTLINTASLLGGDHGQVL
ncbi:MAG: glycoside hydrolase family 15 protein [Actinobacteria bacterium]|nr:glycoside hydrolase family 15 protein [Actinomycetota bacterium]